MPTAWQRMTALTLTRGKERRMEGTENTREQGLWCTSQAKRTTRRWRPGLRGKQVTMYSAFVFFSSLYEICSRSKQQQSSGVQAGAGSIIAGSRGSCYCLQPRDMLRGFPIYRLCSFSFRFLFETTARQHPIDEVVL